LANRGRLKYVQPYEGTRPYARRINLLEHSLMINISAKAPTPQGAYKLLLRLFRNYVVSCAELKLIESLEGPELQCALLALRWYAS
jgi:hypothetical protein